MLNLLRLDGFELFYFLSCHCTLLVKTFLRLNLPQSFDDGIDIISNVFESVDAIDSHFSGELTSIGV